jgi:hypothetical protein
MNVETGAEAALFPEKEYINGIFVGPEIITSCFPLYRKGERTGCKLLFIVLVQL